MRTAKYHDYGALKVVFLFIILVILGLFVYNQILKPAFFHTADEDAWVVEEPTCEADGRRYKICTDKNCGKEFDIEVIPALGHSIDNKEIVTKEPTCTEDGAAYKACKNCGMNMQNVPKPAFGHDYGAVTVENKVEHTSTQGASYENVKYCKTCNHRELVEKVEENHETYFTIIPDVEPTCYATGTGYPATFCKTCDKYLEISDTTVSIDTLPHKFVWNVVYNNGEFSISSGVCTEEVCGHIYDSTADVGYTVRAELDKKSSIKPTCISGLNVYNITVCSRYGETFEVPQISVIVDPTEEHYILTKTGEKVALSTLVNYDVYGRPYYNYSTGLFNLVFPTDRQEGQTYEEYFATAWDENGFGTGTFVCTNKVGDEFHHVQVTLFNDKA